MDSITTAVINLKQLAENYKKLCAKAQGSLVMCSVKANAYGMGDTECSKTLYDAGCRNFAVANISEALKIKPFVGQSEILVLGYTVPENIPVLIENGISQTVYSKEYAEQIEPHIPNGKKLSCHIKIDTGMNRLGFRYCLSGGKEFEDILNIYKKDVFDVKGTFTHFYNSEQSRSDTEKQYERFEKTVSLLKEHGVSVGLCHASNSAAIVLYPEFRLDMVRAGILLYGFSPCEGADGGCRPVLNLKTRISHIHEIEKGESVGYDGLFVADKKMKIATVCIGYGDGFVRNYSGINGENKKTGCFSVRGKKAPIVGNICMDQCMCDITGIEAEIGEEITVVGDDNPVEIFCGAANTISYEFITLLTARVERKYLR